MGGSDSTALRRFLGRCPDCEMSIPSGRLLAVYEPPDGWPQLLAECPDCEAVVHPA
ncbi:DUF7837 family putative zinc-binding protein [Haloarchaeobius baliensis]|uniref:DUF7837 family putative zinc-binding protein n=1 Tax=Haloarchaeobius baliensis TaxID=1670458 RepID=UPI003F885E41